MPPDALTCVASIWSPFACRLPRNPPCPVSDKIAWITTGLPLGVLLADVVADEAAVVLDDDVVDEDPQAANAVEATTPSETTNEVLLKRLMILGRADATNPVTVLPQLR